MLLLRRLVARNMKMFLRDKSAVFFSLLSVFIIIMLYALFLGKINTSSMESQLGKSESIRWFVDAWIMAGILVVNTITVTLGVFSIMVHDAAERRLNSFLAAPVSRWKLTLSYLLAAWIIGVFLTIIAFILAQMYILSGGGQLLSFSSTLEVLGLICLNVFSGSALVLFLASLIKSSSGFSSLSTILGTLIGFVTGIYIPIGVLPQAVQSFMKCVPATYGTALMRQVFMKDAAADIFAHAPAGVQAGVYEQMGVTLSISDKLVSNGFMSTVLVVSGIVFLVLSVLSINRKRSS